MVGQICIEITGNFILYFALDISSLILLIYNVHIVLHTDNNNNNLHDLDQHLIIEKLISLLQIVYKMFLIRIRVFFNLLYIPSKSPYCLMLLLLKSFFTNFYLTQNESLKFNKENKLILHFLSIKDSFSICCMKNGGKNFQTHHYLSNSTFPNVYFTKIH